MTPVDETAKGVPRAAESTDERYRRRTGPPVHLGRSFAFAEVTGEGVEDALVPTWCGSERLTALIAMTTDGTQVRPLGTMSNPDAWTQDPFDFTTWYGDVAVADFDDGHRWTEHHRWALSAKAFVRFC